MKIRVESISTELNTVSMINGPMTTDCTIKVNLDGMYPNFPDKVKEAIEALAYRENNNNMYYVGGRHLGKSYTTYIDEINDRFGIRSSWRVAYEKERDKFEIKDVIFNDPATIVLWADGTKTVVKAENEEFDPEKGLAMAISKRALGGKYDYYDTFKKYVGKYEKKQKKGDKQ